MHLLKVIFNHLLSAGMKEFLVSNFDSMLWFAMHQLLGFVSMRTKVVAMKVKVAIIRLRNKKHSEIHRPNPTKATVWNMIRSTGVLGNYKGPGRPMKTNTVDDRRILTIMKKKHQTPDQIVPDQKRSLGGRRGCVTDC